MKKIGTLLVLICFLILIATVGSCKKEKVIPTLTTNPVTGITTNSGTSGGVISSDGGAAVTARGVCWATSVNPVVSGSHTSDDKGTGSFTSEMTALDANTLYHVRAYATNSEGTAYGKEVTFSTSAIALASLTTQAVTLVTQKTAVSGGSISSDGGGAITARGVCWSTATGPTTTDNKTSDATGTGDFISNLAGLLPGVKYYIRSYATNVAGTSYGNELSFTTNPVVLPTVTTTIASAITLTTAVSGGNVTNDGGGAIIERGVCWAATVNPTITNSKATSTAGTGVFVTNLSGLTPGATYHIRAYATNSAGTAYGEDLNFITSAIVIPTLTTTAISGLTSTSAISGGNISADGGGSVTARGVCWATTLNPTTSNSKTSDATGTGIFVSNLTALTPGVTYHVRAYATNSAGTAYGSDIPFTTPAVIPTVTTTAVTLPTQTTAVTGGNVTADGGATVSARGVCYATTTNPTISNSKTSDASGTGVFVSNLSGLLPSTIYHVRAYATNSAGTAYGADVTFTTAAVLIPTLSTVAVTSIATTTAVSGGTITADGGGAISVKGVCWSTSINPTVSDSKTTNGTGASSFVSNIAGLLPGTVYHVRAYATNPAGTAYGSDVVFTTVATVIPTLTTTAMTAILVTTASSGGDIAVAGAGTILDRGVCWSTTSSPTISDSKRSDGLGTGVFTSNITGLLPGTTYFLRAFATNSIGTGYGTEVTFTTKIEDGDHNTYDIVTIGTQVWMKQNLKTTHYNNGDPILTSSTFDISGETEPKYQWVYDDIEANAAIYGRLYTFYAVTDARGVCPDGYHVPTDAEWTTLAAYLANNGFAFTSGLDDIAKSMAATSGWPTTGTVPGNIGYDLASNNASGFTALPGGYLQSNVRTYISIGSKGYWGSSSVGGTIGSTAWYRNLNHNVSLLGRNDYGPWNGYSIRCVK